MNKTLLITVLLLLEMVGSIKAYNLKQLSWKDGLSNSAILSICQDRDGFMWFGSCDGLNLFDGLHIQVYKPVNDNLSGNLITSVLEAEAGVLWIRTNYGLDRFDKHTNEVECFDDFGTPILLRKSKDNDIFVINTSNSISYYHRPSRTFKEIILKEHISDYILDFGIDSENTVRIITTKSEISYLIRKSDNGEIEWIYDRIFFHVNELLYCFYEDNTSYFIDEEFVLYECNLAAGKKYYICNLKDRIAKKGEISSIIKYRDDYFIGFKTNGLLHIKNTSEKQESYEIEEIDIKAGIFCLWKDRRQDIVWIGTDGRGVYMYSDEPYSLKSVLFSGRIEKPIRSLFLDREQNMWVGTKGDGIVKIERYDPDKVPEEEQLRYFTYENSSLNDNSVFAFAESSRDILWIGGEEGLNYYSYRDKEIKKVNITSVDEDEDPIKYIHAIQEWNDSILWIATVGNGVFKARLSESDKSMRLTVIRKYDFDLPYVHCFSICKENDSILWFGTRGFGAFRLNVFTDHFTRLAFSDYVKSQTINDVFSILKDKNGRLWFGTSFGLITHLNSGNIRLFNEKNGFPNNTVHSILEGKGDELWLSTNRGLVQFNTKRETFRVYNHRNGPEVTEFSDGASFEDKISGNLFFGGVNGFVAIMGNDNAITAFRPEIYFYKLKISGSEVNMNRYMHEKRLELPFNNNFFSISFIAIDYVNGPSYTYEYKLEGFSDQWIDNGFSTDVSFTNIPPGEYVLRVKYRNDVFFQENDMIYSLPIKIRFPWYQTTIAYIIYFLLFFLTVGLSIRLVMKWYRMKKNAMIFKLNQQQKEEIYESKLRFFTNITHEFCTPLTLISGPCEKIISYEKADPYVQKYASAIQRNVEKLNMLISELIEFRRLETGNKSPVIKNVSVSDLTLEMAEAYTDLAEAREINYRWNIEQGLEWNTDRSCFSKILSNLLSNAFKYTPDQGIINIRLNTEEESLILVVKNTGKGIKEEDIPSLFDRYKILDDFEGGRSAHFPRNGLGLAICHSMVKLLSGDISVTGVPNEYVSFKVTLPLLEEMSYSKVIHSENPQMVIELPAVSEIDFSGYDGSKPTVLIVDDDPEMLWFITEIFVEKYNVIPVSRSEEALDYLERNRPDLIIMDVMLPGMDGISLTETIKSDRFLSHIPLILLSAKNSPEDQVKGIEAGAEIYMTKPFNVEYLEKIAARFLQRDEKLKEYFNSPVSSFDLENGRVTHREEKIFFNKILKIIDENISNPELSAEFISASLGISTRHLYRKLKRITDQTPADMIKEYKFKTVEKMLFSTDFSVDEIIYKTGFNNRGHFFKIFSQRYGMTPRKYRELHKKAVKE